MNVAAPDINRNVLNFHEAESERIGIEMEQAKEHAYFVRPVVHSSVHECHRDMPDQLLSTGPSRESVTITLLMPLLTLANRYKKVTSITFSHSHFTSHS